MLSHEELIRLEQKLRDETVLSIYVFGEFADVAARGQWRTELRNALDAIEGSLGDSTHADREGFAAARALAEEELRNYSSGGDAPGWMGLFTATEVHYAAVAPVSVPTVATWSQGANLAPAIRFLKEARPVIMVVTDSTTARIYRYVDRTITKTDEFSREAKVDQPYHMSRPAPQNFSSGTRGRPGTDAAQREKQNATENMLADVQERLNELVAEDAWILIGGIDNVAHTLHNKLDRRLVTRSSVVPIDVHDNDARLAEIAREHASRLRAAEDLKRVEEVLGANAAGGTGAVGLADIDRALFNGQVHELFVTSTFVEKHADEAVSAIRRAFDESATVEHVSGDAAEVLDAAGGIAARLRFTLTPNTPQAAPTS